MHIMTSVSADWTEWLTWINNGGVKHIVHA